MAQIVESLPGQQGRVQTPVPQKEIKCAFENPH
jgi:hypothetical protein